MRSPVPPLTWHLIRSSGRRGLQSRLLAAGAAAVGAFVLLVMVAATLGSGARADRTAWRTPEPVKHGTAVQALATTYVRHEPVTVVSLAQLAGRPGTPAPPGLAAFPKRGEVYVSPALANLLHKLPAGQLADRFPKVTSYGTIGAAGLASPDELVAVVGRAPTDPAVSSAAEESTMYDLDQAARAEITGFSGTHASLFTSADQQIALLGVALLVMPVVVLAAASGRLGAARRERQLAALRLAGATPRQIIGMTALEAAVFGAAGAVAGAALYGALLPALAEVPYGVGGWYPGELWVGLPWLAAGVAGVTGLITVSAVSTLRQVAASPLGVAQQTAPRRTRIVRLVLFVAVLLYFWHSTGTGQQLSTRQAIGLIMVFYGAFWLFGPWVVDRLGRLVSRFARRPATLLAGRRLSDDPRGTWRTVSGLVLAGFAAGFFAVSMAGMDGASHRDQVAVAGAHASEVRTVLRDAGVGATVRTVGENDWDGLLNGAPGVVVHVTGGGQERLDTAVTALTPASPARPPYTQDYATAADRTTIDRFAEVSTATLALGFLVATTSAGLTAAADVLDRRRVYGLLRLAGTPLKVLDRARARETVIPLVVLAGGTTAIGVYVSYRLNKLFGGALLDVTGVLELAGCVALGALAVLAAIGGSRPLLRRVTQDAARTAE